VKKTRCLSGALAASALLAFLLVPLAVRAAESDMSLQTSSGTIQGTLSMPSSTSGRVPVALIIAGSGPTDRNGSNKLGVPVTPYKMLAAALATHGIASVRYDKRGIAASAKSAPLGNPPTFTSYVDDVVAWVKQLRADKRFSRVVLVGHSEGSLLALLAAGKVHVDGVVSLEGAGRPAMGVIIEQLKNSGAPQQVVDNVTRIGSAIRDGEDPGTVPQELLPLFPPTLHTYEQQFFSADPVDAAKSLTVPFLVVQGGADIQVTLQDAHLLSDVNSGAVLRVFPNMTHVLLDATGNDRAASLATYTNTSLPIDPAMTDAVAAFILQKPVPGDSGPPPNPS